MKGVYSAPNQVLTEIVLSCKLPALKEKKNTMSAMHVYNNAMYEYSKGFMFPNVHETLTRNYAQSMMRDYLWFEK